MLASLLMLSGVACKKDGTLVVARPASAVNLTASQQTIVLNEDQGETKALDLSWNKADFGYAASINYFLQVSYKDSIFKKFSSVGLGSATSTSFTTAALNTLLAAAKYPPAVSGDVMFRVLAEVADSLYAFSDTLTLTITPYLAKRVIDYPALYVPGDYQGWDPASETASRLFSVADNGAYEGYVNFTSDTNYFKLTPVPEWKDDYGAAGKGKIAQPGENIELDTSGYCLIKVDIKKLTWSATVNNWGIIGDAAAGWGDADDIMFDFDPETQVLTKTVALKAGGLKLRANHKWDLSIGDGAQYGGENIAITEAGTYLITLDLRVPSEPVLSMVIQ